MQTISVKYYTLNGKPMSVDLTEAEAHQARANMRATIASIEQGLAELAIIHPPVATMPPLSPVGDAPDVEG